MPKDYVKNCRPFLSFFLTNWTTLGVRKPKNKTAKIEQYKFKKKHDESDLSFRKIEKFKNFLKPE